MILKAYEVNKINTNINNIILFYGQNQGAKEEVILNLIKDRKKNLQKYDEKQILENEDLFYENILSKSLFEDNKTVIINRASDKIFKIIENIAERNLEELLIIIEASNLEKRSKLRSFIEKSKKYICVPFYQDDSSVLSKLFYNFIKENNLSISNENMNVIINRCNGDRGILKNELTKIKFFSLNKKKLTTDNIFKLTNLIENHSISELIDHTLAKNKTKIISIINENNLSSDDCIIISRIFLQKCKKLLKLIIDYTQNKNLNKTILNAKPPIFWKDKEIVKKQIISWKIEELYKLIFDLNEIEFQIKKNYDSSVNIIMNFILEKATNKS
tara:strand:- start:105 stop:1094 length:990 start_codon:yes stop_codon:yes gene_type:complete